MVEIQLRIYLALEMDRVTSPRAISWGDVAIPKAAILRAIYVTIRTTLATSRRLAMIAAGASAILVFANLIHWVFPAATVLGQAAERQAINVLPPTIAVTRSLVCVIHSGSCGARLKYA